MDRTQWVESVERQVNEIVTEELPKQSYSTFQVITTKLSHEYMRFGGPYSTKEKRLNPLQISENLTERGAKMVARQLAGDFLAWMREMDHWAKKTVQTVTWLVGEKIEVRTTEDFSKLFWMRDMGIEGAVIADLVDLVGNDPIK